MMALRVRGVGRDADDERTLFVVFDRAPSDDDLRAVHERLRGFEFMEAGDDEAGPRDFAPVEAYGDVAKDYAAACAMLCKTPAFKSFLERRHGLAKPLTDERVAQKVRSLLGVTSRAELNRPGRAADAWRQLSRAFGEWRKAGGA